MIELRARLRNCTDNAYIFHLHDNLNILGIFFLKILEIFECKRLARFISNICRLGD